MITKIKTKFKIKPDLQIIYPLILVLIALYLCFANYTPNTFLTGWDTLHPEFNFYEYFKRILNGAWQSHQGLGAVNTQAHASEIPRIILLYIISLFFKLSDIRYVYAFLMLIIGPLGVFYYCKNVFFTKISSFNKNTSSFLAGLFYLLNLGTLQHFYVPLEMFLTHYGLLGWSFLYLTHLYNDFNKKNLIKFIIVSLLLTSQAHTPTLFYTYFLTKILYLFGLSISFKFNSLFINAKKSLNILIIILLINSFWILPSFYFLATKSSEVKQSKIHHLFSNEAFLTNASFGYLKDISIIKGFLFDWGEYIGNNNFGPLLDEWILHLNTYNLHIVGYLFFVFVLIGVLLSAYNKNKVTLGLFFVSVVSFIFLLSINPPFGFIINYFLAKLPLLKEILRFPFTKFSIFLMFTYAVFFGSFFAYTLKFLNKIPLRFFIHLFIVIITSGSLIFYMLPAFKGNLISKSMRVDIPQTYFNMFEYLNDKEDYGRVVHLPIHSFWGWVYYDWDENTKLGYQGAGFLWFGIKQPLLDREFDRWNIKNEQFYREFSYAIYNKDINLVENILEKYKVRWLLLDTNIIAPGYPNDILYIEEIKSLFKDTNNISLDKSFDNKIFIYKYTPKIDFSLTEIKNNYYSNENPFFRDYVDPFYYKDNVYVTDLNNYKENTKTDTYKLNKNIIGKSGVNENIEDINITSSSDKTMLNGINNNLNLKKISKNFLNVLNSNNYFLIDNSIVLTKENINEFIIDTDLYKNIAIYEKSNDFNINFDFSIDNCGKYNSESYYSIQKLNNSWLIDTKKSRTCVTANLDSFIQTDNNLNINGLDQNTNNTIINNVVDNNISDQELLIKANDLIYLRIDNIDPKDVCIYDSLFDKCINSYVDNMHIAKITNNLDKYTLLLTIDSTTNVFPKSLVLKDINAGVMAFVQSFDINNISIPINNLELTLSKDINNSKNILEISNYPVLCDAKFNNLQDSTVEYTYNSIIYNSPKHALCDDFNFFNLNQKYGYLLQIRYKNISGEPLRICVSKLKDARCLTYFSLPKNSKLDDYYYLLPPFGNETGYSLRLSNIVFGNYPSKNELEYVSFTPISYENIINVQNNVIRTENLFIYNQSYDAGWVAVCGFNLCNANHVQVNNWANGWVFDTDIPHNIKIIFWPQYLQYLGYIFAIIPVIFVIFHKNKK